MISQMLYVSLHERRRERRMQDPEYRAAYESAARELAQTDRADMERAGVERRPRIEICADA